MAGAAWRVVVAVSSKRIWVDACMVGIVRDSIAMDVRGWGKFSIKEGTD